MPVRLRGLPISSFADKTFTDPAQIRNFCIIAHIDHGKSTLADRMLQLTGVVEERGDCVRSTWTAWTSSVNAASPSRLRTFVCPGPSDGEEFVLHLIDTPGHVDFTYEVSRALEACEGAILLVDAAQGIEAQTLANLYLAMEKDLKIIPVLNKIDLPAADPDRYAEEIAHITGLRARVMSCASRVRPVWAVKELLDEVIKQVPAPVGDADGPRPAR